MPTLYHNYMAYQERELETGEDCPSEEIQEQLAFEPCDAIHIVTVFTDRKCVLMPRKNETTAWKLPIHSTRIPG